MGSSFLQHLLHLLCEEIVTQQYEVTFPSCTRKFFHLNWNGQLETEGVHGPTERHGGQQVWQQGIHHQRNRKQRWTTESRLNHMFQLKMAHNYVETTQKWGQDNVNRAKLTCVCVCVCMGVCVCECVLLYSFFITCRIISLVIASNASNCLGLHSSFLFCFGKLHVQTNSFKCPSGFSHLQPT